MNNNNNNTPLSNRSDGTDSGSIISSIYSSNSISSTTTSNNSLINRSFSQQNPITMNSDIDSSIINNTCLQPIDQRRQIIHHLALLLHAHKCLQRDRQATNNGDIHDTTHQNICTVPHCTTMRTVLQHMTKCSDFKNCSCM
ncbi:unnamed protein product [Rotaria sp. Silwood1]|nr:unnamed protein product [Rotaria sp. Silwood1]